MLVRAGCLALLGFVAIQILRGSLRRSPVLGRILLAGTALHLVCALGLFAISWFNLPVLQALHSGDGFWHLAPDARLYYTTATMAVEHGLHTIEPGSPSPIFVATLAIWMQLIGVHPLSPLLFNAFVYVLLCGGIVWRATASDFPARTSAAAWTLGTLSFSPVLLLCGTQVLKDVMFAALSALIVLSARGLFLRLDAHSVRHARPGLAATLAALVALWIGVFGVAGIRAYYAAFVGVALVGVLVIFVRQARAQVGRYVGVGAAALGIVWTAFALGAGPYYLYYHNVAIGTLNGATGGLLTSLLIKGEASLSARPTTDVSSLAVVDAGHAVDALRHGFVLSGGATNLVRPRDMNEWEEGSEGEQAADNQTRSRWERWRDKGAAVAVGVAAIFIPISVLQALDIVRIEGGRGFLYVTDLDTLFIDLTLIGIAWLLIRERRALWPHRMYLCFCVLVAVLSTLLMAYVITNLGTLFRLRLIALVPIWLMPLAVARLPQPDDHRATVSAGRSQLAASPPPTPPRAGSTVHV